jgi:hypothetical protein
MPLNAPRCILQFYNLLNDCLVSSTHCQKSFLAEKFINILIQRKEEVGETQIPEIDAKNIVNVLENLCFSLKHNSKQCR